MEYIVDSNVEKFDASHPTFLKQPGRKVQIQGLNLSSYKYEKIYLYVDQDVDQN